MNSTDVFKKDPEVFEIKRRTPRSNGLSWCGTILFSAGLLGCGYLIWNLNTSRALGLDSKHLKKIFEVLHLEYKLLTNKEIYIWSVFITLFFVLAIILWIASRKAQRGTITISDGKLSCRCENSFVDLTPEQISSVQRNANVVEIRYLDRALIVKSEKAFEIAERVQDFINAYKYSGKPINNESVSSRISANKIREYKQLVDDGIITQEQFDAIISKMTKS